MSRTKKGHGQLQITVALAVMGWLAFGAVYARATEIALQASGDTWVRGDSKDASKGSSTELLVGRLDGNQWIRPLLAFDLSAIPDGSTINSVSLDL